MAPYKNNTSLTHLQAFKKQLHFSDIDNSMIKDFDKYMNVTLVLFFTKNKFGRNFVRAVDQYTIPGNEFSKTILNDMPVAASLEDSAKNVKAGN